MSESIIQIRDLTVDYSTRDGWLRSLDTINLDIPAGEVTALIGESGCGKSTLINAIMGVLAPNARIDWESRLLFRAEDLLAMKPEALRQFRWQRASMVFQAAQNALNPTLPIREQMLDTMIDHNLNLTREQMEKKIISLLEMVHLDVKRVLPAYPHELSGGMRQRVIIALSMVLDPELILLDEPTTALDMITQHFIFDILVEIQQQRDLAMIIITHDIALAAKLAHLMVVMYGGEVMEVAPTDSLFSQPKHPYTRGLLDAIPFIDGAIVKKKAIHGTPPDLINKRPGCVFAPRCPHAQGPCLKKKPALLAVPGDPLRFSACHHVESIFDTAGNEGGEA